MKEQMFSRLMSMMREPTSDGDANPITDLKNKKAQQQ
jgi:hypothetical protein